MARTRQKRAQALGQKYPPSEPCSCEVCRAFCMRPGWWTVAEAARAVEAGYGSRMMLEMAPDRSFGVLSPAFAGCELDFARKDCAANGCTFFKEGLCELYGTGHQPLECRFCHHARPGLGPKCHTDLEQDWRSPAGVALVVRWSKLTGFWERRGIDRLEANGGR